MRHFSLTKTNFKESLVSLLWILVRFDCQGILKNLLVFTKFDRHWIGFVFIKTIWNQAANLPNDFQVVFWGFQNSDLGTF
jgi:hypothetical protein